MYKSFDIPKKIIELFKISLDIAQGLLINVSSDLIFFKVSMGQRFRLNYRKHKLHLIEIKYAFLTDIDI